MPLGVGPYYNPENECMPVLEPEYDSKFYCELQQVPPREFEDRFSISHHSQKSLSQLLSLEVLGDPIPVSPSEDYSLYSEQMICMARALNWTWPYLTVDQKTRYCAGFMLIPPALLHSISLKACIL